MLSTFTILKGKCPFLCAAEPRVNFKDTLLSFAGSSAGEESAGDAGDPSSIPGSARSSGEGISYPLQYFWASLVAQLVKNPPALQKTGVGMIPWRRERLPIPVFWPGEFHGLHSPWGRKELDTTEQLSTLHYDPCVLGGPAWHGS